MSSLNSRCSLNREDSASQRYMEQCEMMKNFAVIQLRIRLRKCDSTQSEMIACTFNFHAFQKDGSNSLFLTGASSLQFLRENVSDFRELFDVELIFFIY